MEMRLSEERVKTGVFLSSSPEDKDFTAQLAKVLEAAASPFALYGICAIVADTLQYASTAFLPEKPRAP
jgi:hypothetical protein